ncbi:hypothetical protein ACX08_05245 [Vibrio parahaemolyticus]|nr:hypothetical protein ACX08_05245 [Vibrio parahaemolyticus]
MGRQTNATYLSKLATSEVPAEAECNNKEFTEFLVALKNSHWCAGSGTIWTKKLKAQHTKREPFF